MTRKILNITDVVRTMGTCVVTRIAKLVEVTASYEGGGRDEIPSCVCVSAASFVFLELLLGFK